MTEALVAIRNAVKVHLEKLEAGDGILVAVSGGADSLALAYALQKEAPPLAISLSAITIDHQSAIIHIRHRACPGAGVCGSMRVALSPPLY